MRLEIGSLGAESPEAASDLVHSRTENDAFRSQTSGAVLARISFVLNRRPSILDLRISVLNGLNAVLYCVALVLDRLTSVLNGRNSVRDRQASNLETGAPDCEHQL